MNEEPMKTWNEWAIRGTLLVIAYGNGTQVVRVRRVTRTGRLEIDRFLPADNAWHRSPGSVHAAKIIGPAPESDSRVHAAKACGAFESAR